ncbi:hypothetical protein [Pseudonocardia acidicola]|uniref:Sensory transduction regulator n=1 Tax=Pseudonocardia acidicola TaxID=2724939 RepID=A0ABX1SPA2_9PSEU|nr:hypothetical protein [Pseudonocardia acidicola]NMI01969.1 hypothetical protein [Pseudonocardia acidicola]
MTWSEIRDLHVEFLTEQGFRPKVDDEGDIHFRFEGRHHFIMETQEDTYFHLLFPNFYPLANETEVEAAALAASAASRVTKVAKVYLNPALDNVCASVELLVAEPTDVHDHFLRCLGMLGTATGQFLEEMTARLAAARQAIRPA